MAYVTKQQLLELPVPDFLVDMILRTNGTLQAVLEGLGWDEAVRRGLSAIEDGLTVQLEETGMDPFLFDYSDEYDRQD